jgi:hypothetical protein
MGRPTKLTPDVQQRIVEALLSGLYAEDAVIIGGICEDTFYEWIKRGKTGEEPFASFSEAVETAGVESSRQALTTVRAGDMGWQGSAWFLERRYPAKWGRRDPDHGVKTKLLEAELETVKAKLELLKAGHDPDAQVINVFIPASLAREGE